MITLCLKETIGMRWGLGMEYLIVLIIILVLITDITKDKDSK